MLPRLHDDESDAQSLSPPLLPHEPSVLMLRATLVEDTVYDGVQILDEGPSPWWKRHQKRIFGALCLLVVGLAVAVGISLSLLSNANNAERIGLVGFGIPSIQPYQSSQPPRSAAPSQSSCPTLWPFQSLVPSVSHVPSASSSQAHLLSPLLLQVGLLPFVLRLSHRHTRLLSQVVSPP